mgnify:CR=1 FL=1
MKITTLAEFHQFIRSARAQSEVAAMVASLDWRGIYEASGGGVAFDPTTKTAEFANGDAAHDFWAINSTVGGGWTVKWQAEPGEDILDKLARLEDIERKMEKSRTTAGDRLWQQGASLDEIKRRVEVAIHDEDAEGIEVWTRVDGGAWVNEGWYKK